MAVPSAVGDGWEVRVEGTQESQETLNVWNFVTVGASSDVELHLILVFIQCFIDHLLPVLTSSWSLQRVVWRKVSPTLGLENVTVPAGAGPGGGNAAALPSYASLCLSLRTTLPGRSGRGRKYIAGIPENATINSRFDTGGAFWAGALAFAACVLAAFVHPDPAGGTDLFDVAVYSRKLGGASLPFGAAGFHDITTITPDVDCATTRSRKLGRGV